MFGSLHHTTCLTSAPVDTPCGTHSSSLVNADLSVREEGSAYASTAAVTAASGNLGDIVATPKDEGECSGDARSAHSRDGATDMPGNHEDPASLMVVRNEDLPYVPAAGATDVDMHVCGDHAANGAMVTAAEGQPRLAGDKVTAGSTMSIPPGSTSSLAAITERLRTASERPSSSADPSPRSAGVPSAPAGTEQQKLEQQEQKPGQKKLEQHERKAEEQELDTIAPAPPAPPHVALPEPLPVEVGSLSVLTDEQLAALLRQATEELEARGSRVPPDLYH
eukprot:jgi/Mesvir1/12166/Mv00410-RA.1